jgi:hypothetical protein
MTAAWQDQQHVFSIRDPSLLTECLFGQGDVSLPGPCFLIYVFQRHQVNLFIIERGHWLCPKSSLQGHQWKKLIDATAVNL